ncbi:DUF3872 domain-containing protein [Parapedobacter sp. 10938]|uniref:DUF3872 domain-containing protein n=1 Tax=Parapedobacter flavus TaxID=3110225 RepID=UPI002DBA5DA7|nr:DUF3872 domain-containing protein [Parapedobacter sp. 10938]MEC3880280.1 DUF3872 domain-containing protein [Parapedobacter sp. 10938]
MKRVWINNSIFLWAWIFAIVITLSSCGKQELDIQQNFPFEVKLMPIPPAIAKGHSIEIRATILPSGNYAGTEYFIRYFQYSGTGMLRSTTSSWYRPNDRYPLPSRQFRLYYISLEATSHAFDVWISDNFGNEQQLSFEFNNQD